MKKLLSVLLVVLMALGCFAISAGAREGGRSFISFTYRAGWEDSVFIFNTYASGKYKVSIDSEGVTDVTYQIVDITDRYWHEGVVAATYSSFPASAEYDLDAGGEYAVKYSFSSASTRDAVLRFTVESPSGGSTWSCTYDPDLGSIGYLPIFSGGKQKVTITQTGTFDFLSYKIWKTLDQINFEEFASYNSFPASLEYELAAGEELYFEFKINRNTKDAVTITFTVEEPETGFWVSWPSWLQWILKYLLFGWLWMPWF